MKPTATTVSYTHLITILRPSRARYRPKWQLPLRSGLRKSGQGLSSRTLTICSKMCIRDSYCTEYGFRVDTEKHAFLLRCNPTKGDYNFYCYCYVKEWLNKHIQKAEQGIRFIDPQYKELFRIPDGGKAVSYTHLDVYKRQPHPLTTASNYPRKEILQAVHNGQLFSVSKAKYSIQITGGNYENP